MLLCDIVGRVWPERSLDGLAGRSLVLVRDVSGGPALVAYDMVDAGVGARVLVATGEPARHIAGGPPVDAVVTAIVASDEPKPVASDEPKPGTGA